MYTYQDPNSVANSATGETQGQEGKTDEEKLAWQTIYAQTKAYRYNRDQRLLDEGYDPVIESALGGGDIRIGLPFDGMNISTGMSWDNKYSYATAVAMGDQMGDLGRGIAQLLQENGEVELIDEVQQNRNEDLLRKLYDYDKYQAATYTGAVIGAIAEPIGLLMPLGKAKTLSTALMKGAALGAAYGGAVYVDDQESRLTNMAFGAALGGPMNAVVSRYWRHAAGGKAADAIDRAKTFESRDVDVFASWSDTAKTRGQAGNVNKNADREFARRFEADQRSPEDLAREAWMKNEYGTSSGAMAADQATAKVTKEAEEAMFWNAQQPGEPRGRLYSAAEKEAATTRVEQEAASMMPKKRGRPKLLHPEISQYKAADGKSRIRDIKRRQKEIAKLKEKPKEQITQEETLGGIEAKAAIEGNRQTIFHRNWGLLDQVFRPLVSAVGAHSKKVAAKMRNMDGQQHLYQHQWNTAIKPFYQWMNGLDDASKLGLKKLLSNGGLNKQSMSYIQQLGGTAQVANAKVVSKILAEIHDKYNKVGYKIGKHENYFPLAVNDLEGLSKQSKTQLDNLMRSAERKNKGPLSQAQQDRLAQSYFTFDKRYSNVSGNVKGRIKRKVTDEELQYYHDPGDALQFYVHSAAEDLAKREFFQGFGHKAGKNGLDPTGGDIVESIDSLINTIRNEVTDPQAQREIVRMLKARFSSDVNKTHAIVQDLKNASYAATLGNWWSAMTQIGDIIFALDKHGIKATVGALLGPKVSDRARLGVEKAMAEIESDQRRGFAKLADVAFSWSGFDLIDRFGKNVNINASIRANKKLAINNPDAFMKKWSTHFGDETQTLMHELQQLKMVKDAPLSDNAHLMLWNDLADVQPIGLSEMPEKYLTTPNMRIAYAYKTFALKQMDYMRNKLLTEQNPFVKAYELTKFAGLFVMANGGIDGLKDTLSGKEIEWEDKWVDNALGLLGTSKYAVDKSAGLGSIILQALAPVPLVQLGMYADKVGKEGSTAGDFVNMLPIVGKANKEWEMIE